MKKIFLLILILPLLTLAEDAMDAATPFPSGRTAAEGQGASDIMPNKAASDTEGGSSAQGTGPSVCKSCVSEVGLMANTNATKSTSGKTNSSSPGDKGKTDN